MRGRLAMAKKFQKLRAKVTPEAQARSAARTAVALAQMNHSMIDAQTERAVRGFLRRIASQYDTAGAILFGSRARGSFKPDSDADVAVLLRGPHGRFLTTKLAMAD